MKVLFIVGKKGKIFFQRMSFVLSSKLKVVCIVCIRVYFIGWFNILYFVVDQKVVFYRQFMGKVVDDIS